mmetsp:Transcript_90206/g.135240  ORF Transcript_90206/g.135240 Transcript_90206/m.135240 type:complete len:427 (+) Transcript_90206:207-1487(+)
MESHRYVRQNLVQSNKVDQYDLNLKWHRSSPSPSPSQYWTNGKVTLLSVPQKQRQPQPQQLQQEAASKPFQHSHRPAPTMASSSSHRRSPNRQPSSSNSSSISPSPSTLIRNSLIAGSVAGMASTMACHPLDVLRIKMQNTALATSNEGVAGTLRATVQSGGVRALYTGLALPLAAQAVYKGTVFTVNNVTQSFIVEWKTQENYKLGNFTPYQITMEDRFWCGFMGGAVNGSLFVTPVEFVRNQLINEARQHASGTTTTTSSSAIRPRGPISVIRQTLRSDGMAGLWKGMASTVLRDSVGCGCFFVSMAFVQQQLSTSMSTSSSPPHHDQPPPSRSVVMASGAVAGLAFWLWALPVDTMKTWIQAGTANDLRHAYQLSQTRGLAQSVPTLFRGWQVAYGRGAPSAAITVLSYSFVYQYLTTTTTSS